MRLGKMRGLDVQKDSSTAQEFVLCDMVLVSACLHRVDLPMNTYGIKARHEVSQNNVYFILSRSEDDVKNIPFRSSLHLSTHPAISLSIILSIRIFIISLPAVTSSRVRIGEAEYLPSKKTEERSPIVTECTATNQTASHSNVHFSFFILFPRTTQPSAKRASLNHRRPPGNVLS